MPGRLTELTAGESLHLLGSVLLGRVVFTANALPTARPVNHIVDDGAIVFRSHEWASIVSRRNDSPDGVVVAYEADDIDPVERIGWSVIVTGVAQIVADPDEAARYQAAIQPWVAGRMDHVLRIRPARIDGFWLTDRLAKPDRPVSSRVWRCGRGGHASDGLL